MAKKAIADISIGRRHRKDLGDIDALAASIDNLGLLHPIVILPDNKLVVGERRLAAFKKLGRETIPVNIARNLGDAGKFIAAECEENTCRKDFTPEEAVAVGGRIEKLAAKEAKERQKKASGGDRRSKPAKKKQGGQKKPTMKKPRDEAKRTSAVAAAAVGMSRTTYEKAKEVVEAAKKAPKRNNAAVEEMNRTGKVSGVHKKLKRDQAVQDILKEPPPLPKGPFRTIVADPPWQYNKRPDDPSHRNALGYPSMTIEEIAAMPVQGMSHKDAVLWLWVTNAHLPEVWPIVAAWGFQYKTMLTWAKHKMGTGDWLRGKTEHCLMCVRGKPTINLTNETTILNGKVRKHSQKPEEFYAMVEKLCPGSKAELFSRQAREGWQSHGNES